MYKTFQFVIAPQFQLAALPGRAVIVRYEWLPRTKQIIVVAIQINPIDLMNLKPDTNKEFIEQIEHASRNNAESSFGKLIDVEDQFYSERREFETLNH